MTATSPGRVRRTQAERRSRSEEALLDAAAAVIAERGIDRASLTSIGTRAGMSRALPAHHFGSKDAMVERVAARAQERLSDAMIGAILRSELAHDEASALDVLRFMVGAYLELFVSPTPDDLALVALWGSVIPSDASVVGLVDADRRAVSGWAVLIERGRVDGSIRTDVDPNAAGVALLALTRGVAALLLIDPALVDLPSVRRTCDDWIATALAPPEAD